MRDFKPHPYQLLIRDHILSHDRCAVWAGMGLGKSASTLMALHDLALVEDNPTLIVAPLRVAKDTWPSETQKWAEFADTSIVPICGDLKQRLAAIHTKSMVKASNYEQLPWLVEHYGDRWPFKTVILDEATKVKGFRLRQGTQRAKALGKMAHTKISRIVELTGTPAPNGLLDLWGPMWFIDKGQRLGRTFDAFKQRWFASHPSGFGVRPLPHASAEIQALLKDVCITVDPADWFDLEKPIVNNVMVDLPPQARKHYREMEKAMFTEVDGHGVEAFNAAAKTIKCLQMANGAVYTEGDAWKEVHDVKLQALDEIVEEAAGMPVLCAINFKSDRERIQRVFKDACLDVGTDAGLKAAKAGKGKLWIGHPASMGHGIDGLQEHTNIAAFFGHWWNMEERAQFIERIGPVRQMQAGKKRPVFIHNIVARGTVDELVMERNESKREVQEILLEAMKRKGAK